MESDRESRGRRPRQLSEFANQAAFEHPRPHRCRVQRSESSQARARSCESVKCRDQADSGNEGRWWSMQCGKTVDAVTRYLVSFRLSRVGLNAYKSSHGGRCTGQHGSDTLRAWTAQDYRVIRSGILQTRLQECPRCARNPRSASSFRAACRNEPLYFSLVPSMHPQGSPCQRPCLRRMW